MSEDYFYINEHEFVSLMKEFNKIIFDDKKSIYEDTFIRVYRPVNISINSSNEIFHEYKKPIYRVDRKRFEFSDDELLRKYPNIVYSAGKYPEYNPMDVVRYSKEVGYIIPHIMQLLYDESYRNHEKAMYAICS